MATVHVIPVDDLREHEQETTCACQPRVDIVEGGMVVVHHAWDNREIIEQTERIIMESAIQIGDTVLVDVREEHDREEHRGRVQEKKDYLLKVVFPSGYWQWTHINRVRKI